MPWSRSRPVKAALVHWVNSIGRCNTPHAGDAMTAKRKRSADRVGHGTLRSPGRPPVVHQAARRQFWIAIVGGASREAAARSAGISPPVGTRWFRECGGMPPSQRTASAPRRSARDLALAEREELAILRAQGHGVREMARRLLRAPSTISRELRRNAATRCHGLAYRATTAPWHADRAARRPKVARLAVHDALRTSVADRLAGAVVTATGLPIAGPVVRWTGRRQHAPPMGACVEPGADCTSVAARLSGRSDKAHQPRSDLPSAVRAGARRAASRTHGVSADGAHAPATAGA